MFGKAVGDFLDVFPILQILIFVGLIMIRTFAHSDVTELAKYASVPALLRVEA